MVTDTLDRSLRDLRISITDRCNFRCAYCMPATVFGEHYQFLPRAELLTFEEIIRITRILVGMGVVKVRLTGGEPLFRREIEKLVAQMATVDGLSDIAMTTNGALLAEHAESLKEAGLKRVTVSLDSLDETVFRQMNGNLCDLGRVLEGLSAANQAGLHPIKINTVVQRGVNDQSLLPLAHFARAQGYTIRFIEYMDVGTLNGWKLEQVVPAAEIVKAIHAELPLEPVDPNYAGEVARRYRYRDGGGEIGVIASVTQPFCGGCTRLRLSPEGEFFTCLFGSRGMDIRGPLRSGASDNEIAALVGDLWKARDDRYSELRKSITTSRQRKVEMYHIGG